MAPSFVTWQEEKKEITGPVLKWMETSPAPTVKVHLIDLLDYFEILP